MTSLNTYINFNGNCKEAFEFYKSVLGGEFAFYSTFGEVPETEKFNVSSEDKDKIMHVSLIINKHTTLMGCDLLDDGNTPKLVKGNNMAVSINIDDNQKAAQVFKQLSEGGEVLMKYEKSFWGAYFGYFKDKYGIYWMVNSEVK